MSIEHSKKNLCSSGEIALLVQCLQSHHEGLSSPVPRQKPGVLALVCDPNAA